LEKEPFQAVSHSNRFVFHWQVESIGDRCFAGFEKLSPLTFESGSEVSTLGAWAFCGCSSLQSIRLPSTIEIVDPSCFENCGNLVDIVQERECQLSVESVAEIPPEPAGFVDSSS
jgi:hypothetical protein